MKDTIIQWAIRKIGGFTEEQWEKAISLVLESAGRAISNPERKEWVEMQLKRFFPESGWPSFSQGVRNAVIEFALRWLKYKGIIK